MTKRFFAMGFVLLLSGCAGVNGPHPQRKFNIVPASTRAADASAITFFRAEGAFSITQTNPDALPTDKKPRPEIANFRWDQYGPKAYDISITSPLDLYQLQILKRLGSITLWKNGTIALTAKTPENIMQKTMGWSLPISNLYYWVRGIPAPQDPKYYHATYDQYGHLSTLTQQGWTVRYTAYKTINQDDLPQTFFLDRPGMSVKIVVRYWNQFMTRFPMGEIK